MTAATMPDDAALSPSEPRKLKRIADDFYPTPRWVVDAIVPHLPRARRILDPACGEGELLDALGAEEGVGIELDPDRCRAANRARHVNLCWEGDALVVDWPSADLCIMNPPFLHAQAFIERAMAWRAQDQRRTVACLARLTILESEARRELHQRNPSDIYVLARRPKFRGDSNGTDSVTACWLVWGPGRGGHWSVL